MSLGAALLQVMGASKSPSFRDAKSQWSTTSSVSCDIPDLAQSGDTVLAFLHTTGNVTFTVPAGWTGLKNAANGAAGASNTGHLLARVLDGSETALTLTTGGGEGRLTLVAIAAAAPLDSGEVDGRSVANATLALGGVTAANDGLLVGMWGLAIGGHTVSSAPAGMTLRFFENSNRGVAVYDEEIVAGATGTRSLTWSASSAHRGFLIAIGGK